MMRQRGQALLEMLLVLAFSLLAAVWAVQQWQQHLQEQQVQSWAGWLLEVRLGVQRYVQAHSAQLQLGDGRLQGFQDPWKPALAELAAQGWLPRGMASVPGAWPHVQIQVLREPGCRTACRMDTVLSLEAGQEWVRRPEVLGQWLLATQGHGLVVHPDRPQRLRGFAGDWANPPQQGSPLWPVGTMAVLAAGASGKEQSAIDMSPYVRLRDERDPDLQAGLSVRGVVRAQGGLQTKGALVLEGSAQSYSACAQESAIVMRAESPGLLRCLNKVWRPLAVPDGGAYMTHSLSSCSRGHTHVQVNPVTGACSCPLGYFPVRIAEYPAGAGTARSYLCIA